MAEYTVSPESQSAGYISSSYYGNESAKQTAEIEQGVTDEQTLTEMGAKLGIDPNTLTTTPTEEVPTTDTPPTSDDDFLEKFNSDKGQQFLNQFKEYTGIDIKEAYQVVNDAARLTAELEGWRQQVVREREVTSLQQEWGSEYDVLMPQIVERFKTLPPAQQQALDNADGARMLAAMIRQEQRNVKNGNVPQYSTSNVRSVSNNSNVPYIRMSEMVKWSGAELDKRMPDVIRAKSSGRFINDL